MKRELRSRMEREIGELQKIIVQNDEDDHFQDLEVQRLRNRVQMASFQYNTSYLHWPGEARRGAVLSSTQSRLDLHQRNMLQKDFVSAIHS